jgi:hypothetical protein
MLRLVKHNGLGPLHKNTVTYRDYVDILQLFYCLNLDIRILNNLITGTFDVETVFSQTLKVNVNGNPRSF